MAALQVVIPVVDGSNLPQNIMFAMGTDALAGC